MKKRSSLLKPSRFGAHPSQKKRKKGDETVKRRSGEMEPQTQQRSYFATRLCIRHLPRGTTEDGIRSFLLRGMSDHHHPESSIRITDCRVLSKGRECLAFVGVSSPDGADSLIARHHRTYLGTSRLVVERAYRKAPKFGEANSSGDDGIVGDSIGDLEKLDRATGSASGGTGDDDAPASWNNVLMAAAAASVMTTKNKFWANEVAILPRGRSEAEGELDDDSRSVGGSDGPDTFWDDHNQADSSDATDASAGTVNEEDDDAPAAAPEKKIRASDLDFLKSIRSGVVDLEQEKEDSIKDIDDHDDDGDPNEIDCVDSKRKASHEPKSSEPEPSHSTNLASVSSKQLTSRVFVRNLPYATAEEDLASFFETAAGCAVVDCHIPVTDQKRPKGFAFVTLSRRSDVQTAIARIDGADFQGRILHLMPAHPKNEAEEEAEVEDSNAADKPRSFKDRREEARRKHAVTDAGTVPGLSSYVRSDAVVESLSTRMGFLKGDILSVRDGLSSGDAAVRLALGETALIEENRKFLERLGISLSHLEGPMKRSNTCILVKNLPADTTEDELMKVFGSVAATSVSSPRLELAPSRTLAVVSYSHRNDAKVALRRLAYRRFKSVPLYLEWAPLLTEERIQAEADGTDPTLRALDVENELAEDVAAGPTSTVHVKNLSFATTEERLRTFFAKHVSDIRAVRIPQKAVPAKCVGGKGAKGVRSMSLGYGFVEFGSRDSCRKVVKELHGALLDGHALEIAPSKTKIQVSAAAIAPPQGKKQQLRNKLVVRNVPFQATRKELLVLFGSFGQLKKIRLPKKFGGTHRGFAFVEFMNAKDALTAFKSLSSTHLYGRHLVIEWSSDEEESDIDKLRDKTKRYMSGPLAPMMSKKIRAR
jgi:multiple RNA-binding domain-containing protein 1